MKMSTQGLAILIEREGSMHTAYRDVVGVWTIGVGHTGPEVHGGLVWGESQVRDAFARDIERFERAVNNSVHVPLTGYQFDALVSFGFNIGEMGVMNSWVVREINNGDMDKAARCFDNWHKPAAIISRRNGEREQFRGAAFRATIP